MFTSVWRRLAFGCCEPIFLRNGRIFKNLGNLKMVPEKFVEHLIMRQTSFLHFFLQCGH